MDSLVRILSFSGGGFSQVKAKLRAESPILEIKIKTPSKQPYRPPSSHFFSCSDPRVHHPALFTPGGDLGEFIIALAALEQANTKSNNFQQQDITLMMTDYLNSMTDRHGKTMFYACTDDASLERLASAAFVQDPLNPASHRELGRVLELVALPENWGSTHLRRMMRDGEGYYVRPQLVKDCITSFMKIHLDQASPLRFKTMLHSLPGAVPSKGTPYLEIVRKLTLKCDKELPMFDCTSYPCGGLSPIVYTRDRYGSGVVVHRDDVNLFRAELAKWAMDQYRGDIPDGFDAESLLLGQINIGAIHADLTRKAVYSESSRYTISFVKDRGESDEEAASVVGGDGGEAEQQHGSSNE